MSQEMNEQSGDSPVTILVVDDVAINLTIIANILKSAGYTVKTALNGELALQLAAAHPQPALILLDIMMPEMDGYAVLQALRRNESLQDIPVIFLTSLDNPREVVKGLHAGANDYVTSPIQSELLLARVATQLQAKQGRDWLKSQNARLNLQRELILETASEGIIGVDQHGRINFTNPAAAALLGHEPDKLNGLSLNALLMPASPNDPQDGDLLQTSWRSGASIRNREISLQQSDGQSLTIEISSTPAYEGRKLTGAVVSLRDRSERTRYLEELERKSNYDDLTGLPNRALFLDRLGQTIAAALRYKHAFGFLMINLPRFRQINDALGHQAGNKVLAEVAQRLASLIRSSDTVARTGSDEFAILYANLNQKNDLAVLTQRILERIAMPIDTGVQSVSVVANIGVAIYPDNGGNAETLFKAADIALVRSHQAGIGAFSFFNEEMDKDAADLLRLEADLRSAMENKALQVHYQPQTTVFNGRICGYEALLRWEHPELGPIPPARFIPIAEETGMINDIGAWVLREACRQNKQWMDAGYPLLPVAVNVSARQFQQSDLVQLVEAALQETGLPARGLELEITESVFLNDVDNVVDVLHQIKRLGVQLALDDFGTGYSSLSHLSRLPFDKIKIDQGFIRDIISNPVNAAIVNATIAMGRSLNMAVLAEGVENEAQLDYLRKQQGEAMQGWLFSKALPPDEISAMLASGQSLKVGAGDTAVRETLLILDDEPNILSSLRRLLRQESYKVITADSPNQAFELLARDSVQVVISDQRMPEMSGTEFLSRVKQMYPSTVRIVLSGYTDLQSLTEAINRGAIYRYLLKPWDGDDLRVQINEAFRVARSQGHSI